MLVWVQLEPSAPMMAEIVRPGCGRAIIMLTKNVRSPLPGDASGCLIGPHGPLPQNGRTSSSPLTSACGRIALTATCALRSNAASADPTNRTRKFSRIGAAASRPLEYVVLLVRRERKWLCYALKKPRIFPLFKDGGRRTARAADAGVIDQCRAARGSPGYGRCGGGS